MLLRARKRTHSWPRLWGRNGEPSDFAKYKRPQFEGPIHKRTRAAESDDGQMTENLSDLLGRVSENSTGGIDSLIGEFEQLPGRQRTDGERIQREIEGIQSTEPTGDATDEEHLRRRGESSSVSGSAHRGSSRKRVKEIAPLAFDGCSSLQFATSGPGGSFARSSELSMRWNGKRRDVECGQARRDVPGEPVRFECGSPRLRRAHEAR
jgi:hypothetical protein